MPTRSAVQHNDHGESRYVLNGNTFWVRLLEFDIDVLKELGAIPVIYIPRGESGLGALGQVLVLQMIDAMCVIDRIAQSQKVIEAYPGVESLNFEYGFDKRKLFDLNLSEMGKTLEGVTYGATPSHMLALGLEGLSNFFYPADADRTRKNPILQYYRQREWRIAGNIGKMDEELMGRAPQKLIDKLLALDADFFGRDFPKPDDEPTNPSLRNHNFGKRLVDWVFVYQGIDKRHIVGAARRVIVPRAALEDAQKILSALKSPPIVVAIEDVSPRVPTLSS